MTRNESASLERIEATLSEIITLLKTLQTHSHPVSKVKAAYTPVEVATILGKRPYTVREWCRLQRINATKRPVGRGGAEEWEISHTEIERIRNHGLLPIPKRY